MVETATREKNNISVGAPRLDNQGRRNALVSGIVFFIVGGILLDGAESALGSIQTVSGLGGSSLVAFVNSVNALQGVVWFSAVIVLVGFLLMILSIFAKRPEDYAARENEAF